MVENHESPPTTTTMTRTDDVANPLTRTLTEEIIDQGMQLSIHSHQLQVHVDEINKMTPQPSPNENLLLFSSTLSPNVFSPSRQSEITVGTAVSSTDKARLRQQSAQLDKWVIANGNNLYPSRDEKERLAKQMNISYLQVNRWFANRRRKQTKKTKITNSPVSLTPSSTSTPASATANQEALTAFMNVYGSRAGNSSEDKSDMVVQHNNETPLTPPAEDSQNHYPQPQVVPDMSHVTDLAVQKLLANSSLLMNPALLAMLQPYGPLQQLMQQQQAMQVQLVQQFANQMAAQQQHPGQAPFWLNSNSIPPSPAHISDSEVSEMSEMSPHPSAASPPPPPRRAHSPLFKDGHRLADPSIVALMDLSNLSEREQLAVNILCEMHTEIR